MEPVGLAKKEAFLGELKKEKEELQRKRKTVTDSTELEKIDKRISLIDNLLNPIDARLQQIKNLDRKNIEEVKQKLLKELSDILMNLLFRPHTSLVRNCPDMQKDITT